MCNLRFHVLLVSVAVLAGCSMVGPFSEYEKALINKPKPASVSQAKLECSTLRAHYDWSLMMIRQRDEQGWDDEREKDVLVADAWADYNRARRIGCTGWN